MGGFANAGVFILLALGLNIVVGLAGLLDLGYAAFFAIGSYAYAFGASSFTGLHVPFWPMLLVGALAAATFGILLGAPTLRLRGDYLAIVTLGFGEIVPAVFLNADSLHRGTNGIGGIRPARAAVPQVHLQRPGPVLRHDDRHPRGRHGARVPPPGLAPWPRLDGGPRGRAGGGQQRRQHRHDQAPGLRPRGLHRRPGRRVQRLQARRSSAPTSSASPSPSRSWPWSSWAAWATPGASPSARSPSTRSRASCSRGSTSSSRRCTSRSWRTSTSCSTSSCCTAWPWWA